MSNNDPKTIATVFTLTGSTSGLSSHELQQSLLKYAAERRINGASTGTTLVRLAKARDGTVTGLVRAIDAAEKRESALPVEQQVALLRKAVAPEPTSLSKALEDVLEDLAAACRKADESQVAAYARMLKHDLTFQHVYKCYLNAPKG